VSDRVVLTLRRPLEHSLDASAIAPDRFGAMSERDISALPVRYGGRAGALGDVFTVRGERATAVHLEGELGRADGLGSDMAGGELTIEGDVGRDLGLAMAGGMIDLRGNAGANAAGARPGAARGVTGGEVIIRGSADADLAAGMRRGVVVVTGSAARGTGHSMIAGTVVVFGAIAAGVGRFLKRGSIVALGKVEPPATFQYACIYRPPHVHLLLRYLQARHGLEISDRQRTGLYERYSGDMGELGKGEMLRWAPD
jgi:formylmethanofuran dehydrogenase subunit C